MAGAALRRGRDDPAQRAARGAAAARAGCRRDVLDAARRRNAARFELRASERPVQRERARHGGASAVRSERRAMSRADVCLLLEGTYPFVRGGVSAWVHQFIGGLPELSFS